MLSESLRNQTLHSGREYLNTLSVVVAEINCRRTCFGARRCRRTPNQQSVPRPPVRQVGTFHSTGQRLWHLARDRHRRRGRIHWSLLRGYQRGGECDIRQGSEQHPGFTCTRKGRRSLYSFPGRIHVFRNLPAGAPLAWSRAYRIGRSPVSARRRTGSFRVCSIRNPCVLSVRSDYSFSTFVGRITEVLYAGAGRWLSVVRSIVPETCS